MSKVSTNERIASLTHAVRTCPHRLFVEPCPSCVYKTGVVRRLQEGLPA